MLFHAITGLLAVVSATSDMIEFAGPIPEAIAIQDRTNYTATIAVVVTDAGLAANYTVSAPFFFLKVGDETALMVREDVVTIYNGWEHFSAEFSSLSSRWEVTFHINDCTIDALDGKTLEVEGHFGTDFIYRKTQIAMWSPASEVFITELDTVASDSEVNVTEIASCHIEGAYPAPSLVQMSIGSRHYLDLPVENGVATLSLIPADLSPGEEYNQKGVSCSFDIEAAGQVQKTEQSSHNVNGTEVTFELQYATTRVDISITGNAADWISGEWWVEKGRSVDVKCDADGNPHPDITNNMGATSAFEDGLAVLTATSTISEDRTTLQCSAEGFEDSVTVRAHFIGEAVHFLNGSSAHGIDFGSRQEVALNFTAGDNVKISCDAPSWNPPATIAIHKGDGTNDVSASMRDAVATEEMSGEYICIASNGFSTQSTKTLLIAVSAPPEAQSGSGGTIAIVIIVIVLIIVLAAVGFFVWKKRQEKADDGTDQDEEMGETGEAQAMNRNDSRVPDSDDE